MPSEIWDWFGSWSGAIWLQQSGTAYLLVNACHILGIGLLVGGILPLDLRLIGFFRSVPIAVIGPFLQRLAVVGLVLAITTGLWLFAVRPRDYATNPAFIAKLALLTLATANVGLQHSGTRFRAAIEEDAIDMRVRLLACVSAMLWLSVLVAGRWIGFV